MRHELYEEALEAIDEGLRVISKTGDRSFEADCWRWKGELLWRGAEGNDSCHPDAAACLHKAIAIACQQKAVSLELIAQVRLSRGHGFGRVHDSFLLVIQNEVDDLSVAAMHHGACRLRSAPAG
jgi:hypothetical protein